MNTVGVDGSPTVIGFRRHLRVATVPGQAVYLTSARGTVALTGDHIETLAPLLDGSHGLVEMHHRTASVMSAADLGHLLGKLAQANLVTRHDPAAPATEPAQQAYWDLAGLDADRVGIQLARSAVRLIALGGVAAEPTAEALAGMGVSVHSGPEPVADLTLVLCSDYLDPELEQINARQLAAGNPWMLARPASATVWVGPVLRPFDGPCWECLAVRLRRRHRGAAWLRSVLADPSGAQAPETHLPVTRALGANFAALQAVKWLIAAGTERANTVWTFDTFGLEQDRHPVERRPQCAACGDPGTVAARVDRPVVIESRPKSSVAGNGHRSLTTEQMWVRYRHLADPVTGVTHPIVRDPRCPGFLHSYVSGPNLALADHSLGAIRTGLREQSGGKGRTEIEAQVGALCEAVERYSGSRLGDEPTVRGSFRRLGERALHPDQCQLFDRRQFTDRDRWNADNMHFQHVPRPFDEDEVLDWTPVWSLTHNRHRLLPTDLLYFNRAADGSVRATSNGNAAGSSLEDATVQGFLELVERDAVALWWYNRTRHPAVDLASFDDPWIDGLVAQYRSIGREFWVLDLTSDLDIPVMAAVSRRVDKPAQDIMLGFGAHFDPHVALRRALTELGQLLPAAVGAGADGPGAGSVDRHIEQWWRTATTDNQPYLCPAAGQAVRGRAGYRYAPRQDLREDIEHIVSITAREGLEVYVLDQTRPDIGMPVVKVIVPGMRHFWARFAPGRLYDVPVRLGRLAAPTAYGDLNPIPLFL